MDIDEIDVGGWLLIVIGVGMVMGAIFMPLTPLKALVSFQPGFGMVQIFMTLFGIGAAYIGWKLVE